MRAFASKGRGGANFRDSKDGSVLFLFFRKIRPTVTKSVPMWVRRDPNNDGPSFGFEET
jgi:hypothetical protein